MSRLKQVQPLEIVCRKKEGRQASAQYFFFFYRILFVCVVTRATVTTAAYSNIRKKKSGVAICSMLKLNQGKPGAITTIIIIK